MKTLSLTIAAFLGGLMFASCAHPVDAPAPADGTVKTVPASDSQIQYSGRFDFSKPDAPRFSYSGTKIRARFEASTIAMLLADEGVGGPEHRNFYSVTIDKNDPIVIEGSSANRRYPLAFNLTPGPHTVQIEKRTEPTVGSVSFLGFELNGRLIDPPTPPDRRIEFLGDSLTVGYGNMVSSDPPKIGFDSSEENYTKSFASVASRILGAEDYAIAYSGRGLIRSYDTTETVHMPEIYKRIIADDPEPRWDFSNWTPQVVVIDLGTNDYANPGLDDTAFTAGYEKLVTTVRGHYPKASIICCIGPGMTDVWPEGTHSLTRIRNIVTGVVKENNDAGDKKVYFLEFPPQKPPFGASHHPTIATHQQMAEQLVDFINHNIKW